MPRTRSVRLSLIRVVLSGLSGCVFFASSAELARAQIPLFPIPDRISVYAQGSTLWGASDLEANGSGPASMPGVGVELGYHFQAEQGSFARNGDFELGIGYDFQAGYRARDPALDFRGAVQALPSISLYASKKTREGEHPHVYPYLGLRTGYLTLLQAVMFDASGVSHKVDASTYELGLVFGLQHSSGWYLEASGESRRFRSLRFDPASRPGDGLPRDLNASQLAVAIGFEVFKAK